MKSFLFLLLLSSSIYSQTAIVSGGGSISNSGSVTYTIGQILVDQNIESSGSIFYDVQQPFELLALNLESFTDNINYSAYPNPTSGLLNLKTDNAGDFPYQLKMYDIRGRLIKSQILKNNNSKIDITNQARGVYLLQLVKTGKQVYSFKILKN